MSPEAQALCDVMLHQPVRIDAIHQRLGGRWDRHARVDPAPRIRSDSVSVRRVGLGGQRGVARR